jgi:thiamine pyrophosphokinase
MLDNGSAFSNYIRANKINFKSIIVLDGDLPINISEILQNIQNAQNTQCSSKIRIIAADGAANKLYKAGIIPDIAVGDLDSIKPDIMKIIPTKLDYDQNYCDFYKCIEYVKNEILFPSLVIGMEGGHFSHVIQNINIFMKYSCENSAFYTDGLVFHKISTGKRKSFKVSNGKKVFLYGMPRAIVSTIGLKWNLNKDVLEFPGFASSSNMTLENHDAEFSEFEVQVFEGLCLVSVDL